MADQITGVELETTGQEVSPIGTSATEASRQRAARSSEYRQLQERFAVSREIAWQVIKYRTEHGLTQEELAVKVGTSYSQIARIESGRYRTSQETLERLARAMGKKLRVLFEDAVSDGLMAEPEAADVSSQTPARGRVTPRT